MRIYEGTPRQDWEKALRVIGAFADREGLKDLLLVERDESFLLQGLRFTGGGAASETLGSLGKRSYDIDDNRIGELMDEAEQRRGGGAPGENREITNFYEMALRVLGRYIDSQRPHDIFFLEQDGSFIVRLYGTAGSQGAAHQLAEFTREDILAMIESAQQERR